MLATLPRLPTLLLVLLGLFAGGAGCSSAPKGLPKGPPPEYEAPRSWTDAGVPAVSSALPAR